MKINFSFFQLPSRIELLPDLMPPDLDNVNSLLEPFGLRVPKGQLAEDLYHVCCGARVKAEVEHHAEIQFQLNTSAPLWLKVLFPLRKLLIKQIIAARLDSLCIFRTLSEIDFPGYSIENRFVSCIVLYYMLISAKNNYKTDLNIAGKFLSHLVAIAKSIDEYESELLGSLLPEEEMARFPKILQEQFDKQKIDGEMYFAGEEAQVIYALSRSVQALRAQKSFSKQKQVESAVPNDLIVALDLLRHPARYLIINTSKKLERFSAFDFVKKNKFYYDPDGDEYDPRPMESLGEISRIAPQDFGYLHIVPEYFMHRLVTLDFQIKDPGRIEEIREVAYVMIDKSPSTLVSGRWCKAFGVLFNRMLGIIKADAIVVLQFFDAEVEKPIGITNFNEAMSVLKYAAASNFMGSGTDLNKAIRTGAAKLQSFPKQIQVKPHLIIVSDGKDEVHVQAREIEGIRLHAFVVSDDNYELQKLCHVSGGIYMSNL